MANRIVLVRRLLFFLLCLAPCLLAQANPRDSFRFSVFSLFKPTHLIIRPAKNQMLLLTLSKSSVVVESESDVRTGADGLRIVADGHDYSAVSLLVTSRDGGPTGFMLVVPGKITRNFRGTLEITQSRKRLRSSVSIESEVAVASAVKAEAPPGAV